jgi:17beta-estradiol 17-dehydrogenase / very-long-chain 3-oxoacyl-CoA reductase
LVVKTIPAIILWAFLFLKFNPISFFGVCASLMGAIVLVKVSLSFGLFVWEQWFMKQVDLVKRYGRDSWAVISGGSDGIGLAFAEKLAEAGINVVLVARNEEKLKDKLKILTAAYKAKVQYRVADFSKGDSPEFYTELYNTMKDLDVSILVNNVGIGSGAFLDCETKSCWDQGIVNMVPQFMMTKVFFNHFRARTTQSAVIDVSSITSLAEFVDCGLYGGTKSFNRAFSQNMQEKFGAEYGIDFLVLKPGFV